MLTYRETIAKNLARGGVSDHLLMWPRRPYEPGAYDDDWEDQPAQSSFHQWALGVVLPLVIFGYGLYAVLGQHVTFDGRVSMILNGVNAIAYGVACISAAMFLHCHCFWGNVYDQIWFAVLGKIIAACGFIGGLVTLIVRVGVLDV